MDRMITRETAELVRDLQTQLPEAGSSGGCPVVPLAPPASPTPGDEARAEMVERANAWLAVRDEKAERGLPKKRGALDRESELVDFALSETAALRGELEQAQRRIENLRQTCEDRGRALELAEAELARAREQAETAERLCIERIRAEVQERVNRWTKLMESAEFEDSRARRAAIVLELEELRHRISSVGFFAQAAPHATHALHRAAWPGTKQVGTVTMVAKRAELPPPEWGFEDVKLSAPTQVGTFAGVPIVADPSVPEGQMVARQHQPTDADVLEKAEKRCPECGRPWWSPILSRCPWSGHSRPPNPLRRPAGGGEGTGA